MEGDKKWSAEDVLPIPLAAVLKRINLPPDPPPPGETLCKASAVSRQVVEDFRPLGCSLEWQLADLHWIEQGVRSFVNGQVPYVINNNGRLSEDAAALLFANCLEAPPEDRITVLELGAGSGLFARYFLDEFQLLCERESRDFYHRLTYRVTDRSPRTVEQWREREIFVKHAEHVDPGISDAARPAAPGPLRAAFCNYVLDSLPTAILRSGPHGWEQACVRTSIPDDRELLRQYTSLSFEEIRVLAASDGLEQKSRLLPLLPLLELDVGFLPVSEDPPPGIEKLRHDNGVFAYNYGACQCLEELLGLLDPAGFVFVNDFGPARTDRVASESESRRYGSAVAVGLNFPLLEERLRASGVDVVEPEGDEGRSIHARLLVRGELAGTRQAFRSRRSAHALADADSPVLVDKARQLAAAGRRREALDSFRAAIQQNPRDWYLIGEAATFVATQLGDPRGGLDLARAALDLNPWYSTMLWNILGDILWRLERYAQAHECYLQACRIDSDDPRTNFNLAHSWLRLASPERALAAVAAALANDSAPSFRDALLDLQRQALLRLGVRWKTERDMAARRAAGLDFGAS